MFTAKPITLPPDAALNTYAAREATHTDCFFIDVPGFLTLQTYIELFFDTWLFRLERHILTLAGFGPAGLPQIQALANGQSEIFAAWMVETRKPNQILMKVGNGHIRTWLQCDLMETGSRLYFGSAVLPNPKTLRPNRLTAALTPLHLIYAKALLGAAARKWNATGK